MKTTGTILDKIVEDKKERLKLHKEKVSLEQMQQRAKEAMEARPAERRDCFYKALKKEGISIIGEFKKASPSLGQIQKTMDLLDRIDEYNACVDAISVLTEEDHFSGCAEDLVKIRSLSPRPILRKDFMIDPYQFYEARAIGADAVLLITAILDDGQMKEFYDLARSLDLDVLVETHDEEEVARALKIEPRIIGINNRDLRDFSISIQRTKELRSLIPADKVCVAESGIVEDGDVRFLKEAGADAFLIGRAFMESDHPQALAKRWRSL